MMSRVVTGILVLALCASPAVADQMMDMTGLHAHEHATSPAKSPQVAIPETDGEIVKVDTAAKQLTVKHGRIESLDMAPMTMPYAVKDPSFLNLVKPGDKVKMTVEQVRGTYTIVALQRAPCFGSPP